MWRGGPGPTGRSASGTWGSWLHPLLAGELEFEFAEAVAHVDGVAQPLAEGDEGAGGAEADGRVLLVEQAGDGVGGAGHVVGHAAEGGGDELVAVTGDEPAEGGPGEGALNGLAADAGLLGRVGDGDPGREGHGEVEFFLGCDIVGHCGTPPEVR